MTTRNAPPRASAMLESLRGLGYSTAAALADIIDNSISAGAKVVDIQFNWENKYIYILDDGLGMTDQELESAMTLGDKNPIDVRSPHDLGRFGMGLKTASFSQCKSLTVASKKRGGISCLRWDLELLATNPDLGWVLLEGAAFGSEQLIEKLFNREHGTIVIWEKLDRVVTDDFTVNDFLTLIDERVTPHLSMTFHRLITGANPKVLLTINGNKLEPWDPFLDGHPAKPWSSPVQIHKTPAGNIEIQCNVLPHRDKLSDDEYLRSGGPEGWHTQQGFYVYRNLRLLVAGGWLGLGYPKAWHREEPYKLARIQLDIPNAADAAWKIDVKKSVARPPLFFAPMADQYCRRHTRESAQSFRFPRYSTASTNRSSSRTGVDG